MAWKPTLTPAVDGDVIERGFELDRNGGSVPGVYWAPPAGGDKLIMLGHGGTGHKKQDYIELIARGLCAAGMAAVAIDGPMHGDRPGASEYDSANPADFARRWNDGGGTDSMIADWQATADFIEAEHGPRPTGWWGLSMGTMVGLPVCVAEPRISAAVLGLMGLWGPNEHDLRAAAPQLAIPTRFLVQWDDEIVPRNACLELFDALGAPGVKKTLHANPGSHSAVPTFEVRDSVAYLNQFVR